MANKSPQLLIILGCPASGKTTLARRLGADLRLACLCKDDVKEALFDVLGVGNRDWSRRLSDASFAALARCARTQCELGQSCILEGNWRAAHARELSEIVAANGVRAAQICCRAERDELARRFASRSRHPGHLDASVPQAELRARAEAPPAFLELDGPRWIFDSESHTAYEKLAETLKNWLL